MTDPRSSRLTVLPEEQQPSETRIRIGDTLSEATGMLQDIFEGVNAKKKKSLCRVCNKITRGDSLE